LSFLPQALVDRRVSKQSAAHVLTAALVIIEV
jgi:hypothetical protein